jgi:hypothetical protein
MREIEADCEEASRIGRVYGWGGFVDAGDALIEGE